MYTFTEHSLAASNQDKVEYIIWTVESVHGCTAWKPYLCGHQASSIVRSGIFNNCLFLGGLFHHFCVYQ